jgi:hypothetical protein
VLHDISKLLSFPSVCAYSSFALQIEVDRISYREMFSRTGLLVSRPNDVVAVFEKSAEHISPQVFGEITPTVGKGLNAEYEGYDGIILIGPFNCLPFRISEAILRPLSILQGMPLLAYETDGCAVAPAVLRQVRPHSAGSRALRQIPNERVSSHESA